MPGDTLEWQMNAKVLKYEPLTVARLTERMGHEPLGFHLRHLEQLGHIAPDEITDVPDNVLTNGGLGRITSLIIGGGVALAHADAMVGVGTGTAA